jgi:hypothetical protein
MSVDAKAEEVAHRCPMNKSKVTNFQRENDDRKE